MIRKKLPLPAAGGDEGEGDQMVLILSTPTPALPHCRGRGCLHNYGLISNPFSWFTILELGPTQVRMCSLLIQEHRGKKP